VISIHPYISIHKIYIVTYRYT